MVRMQIQLKEHQAAALRELAQEEQRSIADLVREAISRSLAERGGVSRDELARRARALRGRFSSGCVYLAEKHDHYLADAIDS